jgi:DNA replication protein
MKQFQGFASGKTRLISIPSAFFSEIVPEIDDINVLKLMLYFFVSLDHQDGKLRFVQLRDMLEDKSFKESLVSALTDKEAVLISALEKAVVSGFILRGETANAAHDVLFFLNSAKGREAYAALQSGAWSPGDQIHSNPIPPEQPGIFQLYEDNIGPITPMIADLLEEAEKLYPPAIIQFAFGEAVQQNARSWKYIDAILRNWQKKGSHGKNSSDPEKDRRKYIEGEYAEFINHE